VSFHMFIEIESAGRSLPLGKVAFSRVIFEKHKTRHHYLPSHIISNFRKFLTLVSPFRAHANLWTFGVMTL